MKKIVECVPNFSEGKDQEKITKIINSIQMRNVKLCGVASDPAHNRTVVTFAGEPDEVKEAAFGAIKTAAEVIDMSLHVGQHPRIGATDVCPFVPISTSMQECVQIARELGERVGRELEIPVFLYGEAAVTEERKLLSSIRKGEYEGLNAKLALPEWKPDYGPTRFNPTSGVSVIGARPFLVAFNINLNTGDVIVSKKIAAKIRESGTMIEGKRVPGTLKTVQALGVFIKERNCAQVTMNLNNYNITGLYEAFEEVQREAKRLGYEIMDAEIIGVVPKAALVEAGRRWTKKDFGRELSEVSLIEMAVKELKLRESYGADFRSIVLEYILGV